MMARRRGSGLPISDDACRSILGGSSRSLVAQPGFTLPRPAPWPRDPRPGRIGQAVPDGGQLGHLRRDRIGLNEARRSLGLGGCGSGYAPAKDGTASPPLPCGRQASRPSTIARIRRRSSSVSEPQFSTTCLRLAGSAPDFAPPGFGIVVFPGEERGSSSPISPILHAEKAIHGLFPLGWTERPARLHAGKAISRIDRTRGYPQWWPRVFRFLRLLAGGCGSLRRRMSRLNRAAFRAPLRR